MREIKFRAWDYTSNVMRNDITEMVFNSDGTLNQINVETYAATNALERWSPTTTAS